MDLVRPRECSVGSQVTGEIREAQVAWWTGWSKPVGIVGDVFLGFRFPASPQLFIGSNLKFRNYLRKNMAPQVTHFTWVFGARSPMVNLPFLDLFAVNEVPWHFGHDDSPVVVATDTWLNFLRLFSLILSFETPKPKWSRFLWTFNMVSEEKDFPQRSQSFIKSYLANRSRTNSIYF